VIDDPEYVQRRTAWNETSGRWVRHMFAMLSVHARAMARGDRGVLKLTIDTLHMEDMLTATTVNAELNAHWFDAVDFAATMSDPGGVGPETAWRWLDRLERMDPAHDVALFLCSTPDDAGRWFSRFLVIHDSDLTIN
jgi:hypothetical protein